MKENRVLQVDINKNNKFYKTIDELCFKSKNIYNYANYIIRQVFIITTLMQEEKEVTKEQQDFLNWVNDSIDKFNVNKANNLRIKKEKGKSLDKEFKPFKYFDKNNRFCSYNFIDFITKDSEPFKDLGSNSAQSTLRVLDKNWKSFFKAIKDWSVNPNKYLGRPRLPNYKNKATGRFPLYLTNTQIHIKDKYIYFSWNPLKGLNDTFLFPYNYGRIVQARFIPKNQRYVLEVVYEINVVDKIESNNRIIGIDIGLNNLMTVVNNINVQPFVINGKPLKSINQYYNKEMAKLKSEVKLKNNQDWSNSLQRLTDKRNNKIKDYIHKASRYIVNYCLINNIDTIVVGKNKNWKQKSDMCKKVNQSFIQIPFAVLIDQITYKARTFGIQVIQTEESYTSGTSFLDGEEPIEKNYNKSRRIHRGLFKSEKGVMINADVNGAYQIIRKVIPDAFDGIEGVGLHPVIINL